jgi:chromosome partitioning protein
MEFEPQGKAAEDIRHIYKWTCQQIDMSTQNRKRIIA